MPLPTEAYLYTAFRAWNLDTNQPIGAAPIEFYAHGDEAFATPLEIWDTSGNSLGYALTSAATGDVSPYYLGVALAVAKSGSWTTPVQSMLGLQEVVEAILAAALAAQAAAEAAVPLPLGGSTGQLLSKASAVDGDAEWVTSSAAAHAQNHLIGGSDPISGMSMSQVTDLVATLDGSKVYYEVKYDVATSSWPAPPSSPNPPLGYDMWRFHSPKTAAAQSPHLQTTSGKDWSFLTTVDKWRWAPHHSVDPT